MTHYSVDKIERNTTYPLYTFFTLEGALEKKAELDRGLEGLKKVYGEFAPQCEYKVRVIKG